MEGELRFFLGLQIRQAKDDIFVNQYTYVMELVSKFGLGESKPLNIAISANEKVTKDTTDVTCEC